MSKTILVPITLTPEQKEKAQELSKELFGKINVSGLYAFYIEKEYKLADSLNFKKSLK